MKKVSDSEYQGTYAPSLCEDCCPFLSSATYGLHGKRAAKQCCSLQMVSGIAVTCTAGSKRATANGTGFRRCSRLGLYLEAAEFRKLSVIRLAHAHNEGFCSGGHCMSHLLFENWYAVCKAGQCR